MGAREVPPEAITEAAEAVAEKIDVLLERATDAVLGAPQPGSDAWQQAWAVRDTDAGLAANAHRTRVKTAIAVPPQKRQKQSNTVRHGDDLDYDVFLDRYPGGSIEVWQKSVAEAKKQFGSTADLDYAPFLDRYKGRSFEGWQESVEEAMKQIVAEANPAARVSCEWRYSDDEDFYEDAYDE